MIHYSQCLLRRRLNDKLDFREGYPNIRTVDYWLGGEKSERFPQSKFVGLLYRLPCEGFDFF